MNSRARKIAFLTLAVLLIAIFSASALPAAANGGITISWTKILSESAIGVDWSPDGTSIVLDDTDKGQIELINWQTGAVIWHTPFPSDEFGWPFSARWSRDGKWIAATANDNLYLIDPQTGHLYPIDPHIPVGRKQPYYVLARWGVDSTLVAALDANGYIDIFSVKTDEITETIDLEQPSVEGFYYSGFDWSPDGRFFAAPVDIDGAAISTTTMGFWDSSGNLLTTYSRESQADTVPTPACSVYGDLIQSTDDVEWANDSRTVAVGGMYGIGVCRLNVDGSVDNHRISYRATPSVLRWSPDQKWLVGGLDTYGDLWITDAGNNEQMVEQQIDPTSSGINSLAWSPDSQHLAVGTERELWIGTLHKPEAVVTPEATIYSP